MSWLSKLQIAPLKRNPQPRSGQARRAKLLAKLQEQLALAEAQAKGKQAIVIGSYAMLPWAINTLIQATEEGELTAAISASVDSRKLNLPTS